MTRKLYSQYEEKLQAEQQKHSAEKEALLVGVKAEAVGFPHGSDCVGSDG